MVNELAFYDLLLSIKGDRNLFVETGTAVGSTSEWASTGLEKTYAWIFDQVVSLNSGTV